MLITSVDTLMVLGCTPDKDLPGNSAAKAGGAEIESSIFTKRPFLAWESVQHNYHNFSVIFIYGYNIQVNIALIKHNQKLVFLCKMHKMILLNQGK